VVLRWLRYGLCPLLAERGKQEKNMCCYQTGFHTIRTGWECWGRRESANRGAVLNHAGRPGKAFVADLKRQEDSRWEAFLVRTGLGACGDRRPCQVCTGLTLALSTNMEVKHGKAAPSLKWEGSCAPGFVSSFFLLFICAYNVLDLFLSSQVGPGL
jgi:hypothetical protein